MKKFYSLKLMAIMIILFGFTNTILLSQSLSTMTYNIRYNNPDDGDNWWDHRKEEVVKLMQYYQPDILGIQEGKYEQVQYIDDHLFNYNYIGVGRDDGATKGEYTAIYFDTTKLDVKYHETFWLSKSPHKVSVGWDASMERICTYGHFKHKRTNKEVHVFNAHFDHRGPLARANSAKLINRKIKELGISKEEIILMGDFNCLPDSPPIIEFIKQLDDASKLSGQSIYGPIGTFNHFDLSYIPDRRIDYIFSKNMTVQNYRHIDDRRKNNLWPSDHLPVLVYFDW